jgi:hypothetical protein
MDRRRITFFVFPKIKSFFSIYTSSFAEHIAVDGYKQRHSFKITKKVFEMIKNEIPVDLEGIGSSLIDVHPKFSEVRKDNLEGCYIEQEQMKKTAANEKGVFSDNDKKPAFCKKRITVVVKREKFLDIVCAALSEYRYVSPNQRMDLIIACRYYHCSHPEWFQLHMLSDSLHFMLEFHLKSRNAMKVG